MKTVIPTLVLLLVSSTFFSQSNLSETKISEKGITITVTVPTKSDQGSIIAGLYNEATFMKAAPLQGVEAKIENGIATLIFTNIAPGEYGISIFHDANGNKIMDFEPNGMPKEMYGVSNNVMNFGPPQWSDAAFTVTDQPLEMEIRF